MNNLDYIRRRRNRALSIFELFSHDKTRPFDYKKDPNNVTDCNSRSKSNNLCKYRKSTDDIQEISKDLLSLYITTEDTNTNANQSTPKDLNFEEFKFNEVGCGVYRSNPTNLRVNKTDEVGFEIPLMKRTLDNLSNVNNDGVQPATKSLVALDPVDSSLSGGSLLLQNSSSNCNMNNDEKYVSNNI